MPHHRGWRFKPTLNADRDNTGQELVVAEEPRQVRNHTIVVDNRDIDAVGVDHLPYPPHEVVVCVDATLVTHLIGPFRTDIRPDPRGNRGSKHWRPRHTTGREYVAVR